VTRTFTFELSTSGTPEEVRARVQPVLARRLLRPSAGGRARNLHREMRLSAHTATSLSYRPKLVAPLPVSTTVWLGRLLRAERIDIAFAPDDDHEGSTRVVVSGTVGRGGEALADRELWEDVVAGRESD